MLYYSPDIIELSFKKLYLENAHCGRKMNQFKFWYILSTIHFLSVVDPKYNKQERPFVSLNAKRLKKVVGRHRLYLDYLIDNGVIETDNHYITAIAAKKRGVKPKSKGFRLSEKYQNAKFVQCHESHNLNIDLLKDETEKYILSCLEGLSINESIFNDCSKKLLGIKLNRANSIVDLIRNREFFTTRSEKTGRLFSNVTCLGRDFKKSLYFYGEKVSVADVKACQPSILYSFYKDRSSPEAIKYKELIETGKFYEFFSERLLSYYKDRNAVKKPFYVLWFGDENNWGKKRISESLSQLKYVFTNNFPILWSIMRNLKNDDYAAMACELQRKESDLIFNGVVQWCIENNIKCLTIHDCLLCQEKDILKVSARMKEIFDQSLGLSNIISVESY